jgi:hypothetical protein
MTHPSQHKSTKVDMDAAAKLAEAELETMLKRNADDTNEEDHIQDGFHGMMRWFKRWYLLAGHKRLGRMLVKRIKEIDRETQAD